MMICLSYKWTGLVNTTEVEHFLQKFRGHEPQDTCQSFYLWMIVFLISQLGYCTVFVVLKDDSFSPVQHTHNLDLYKTDLDFGDCFTAECHKTDSDILGQFLRGETLFYSQISTVPDKKG